MNTIEKACPACGELFPATLEFFNVNNSAKDGLRNLCKSCHRADAKRWRLDNLERAKQSSKNWRENNREKAREDHRAWRAKNPDLKRASDTRYREKNKEALAQRSRDWCAANPERRAELRRKSQAKHRDRHNESTRLWRKNNPEKSRLRVIKRRSRKASLSDTFSVQDWKVCLAYFNGCCAYCGCQRDFWHTIEMEHFIPLAHQDCPGTVPKNIVPACRSCNARKSNTPPEQWLTDTFGKHKAKKLIDKIRGYFDTLMDD